MGTLIHDEEVRVTNPSVMQHNSYNSIPTARHTLTSHRHSVWLQPVTLFLQHLMQASVATC